MGTTEYRLAATRPGARRVRRGLLVGLAVSVASAVWLTLLTPATFADDLTDQRKQIQRQITQTKHDLSESSAALQAAGVAVARTQAQLDLAEAKLAQTQRELAVARGQGRRGGGQAQEGPGRPRRGQGGGGRGPA